jgi:tetratricopeptide (TPR) repeat protein
MLSALAPLLVFLARWFIASNPANCATDEEQTSAHFHAGQEAMKAGDFARAVAEFKKVLALDPDLPEAEVNLGLAYHSLGEYRLAVSQLAGPLRQKPDLLGPRIILGTDYMKLGSPEKAIPVLQQALKLDASNQEARRPLAMCYRLEDNYREAADQFRRLSVLDQDKPEAWYRLGHDYLDLAARLAYRGARLFSDSAWGHRFLGDTLAQRSQWNDAEQEYRQALAIEPKQPGLHVSLGQAYLQGGKAAEAEAEFRLELQLDKQSEPAWLGLAETGLAKGEATAGLEAVRTIWEISPEFLSLQREFPAIELSSQTSEALLKGVLPAAGGAPRDFILSGLYGTRGETQPAQESWAAFQTAVGTWQKAELAKAEVGMVPEPCRAHRYAACARRLQSRKQPTLSERLLLGRTQITLRQNEPASETFGGLLAIDKDNVEASYWLARSYLELGAECFARLEESYPQSWRAHQLSGEGDALRGATNDAIKEFQLAIQLRPDSAELHEALGELYLTKDADEEARAELEKALSLDSFRSHALCLLGRMYVRKRETEKAVPYLQAALRYQPDLVEACSLLGTAYVRLGQYASAVPELQKAASSDFYGNVHYQLYMAYRKLGKPELAQKALAQSEELRRTSAQRHQALVSGVADVE